jgi:hypothetical protein
MGSGFVYPENQFLVVALSVASIPEDQLGVIAVSGLSGTAHGAEELNVTQFGCLTEHLLHAFVFGAQLFRIGSAHPGAANTGRKVRALDLLGLGNPPFWWPACAGIGLRLLASKRARGAALASILSGQRAAFAAPLFLLVSTAFAAPVGPVVVAWGIPASARADGGATVCGSGRASIVAPWITIRVAPR